MDTYITSPYLRFTKTNNGTYVIYNFLLDKLQEYRNDTFLVLQYCKEARGKEDIIQQFGSKLFYQLVEYYQILSTETIWKMNFCNILEIETSTICTWKCEYCPVRNHNRQTQFIDFDLFKEILEKASEYGFIKQISLTSYNEASLDGNFINYIREIDKNGFKLLLYTNGSCLTEDKIKAISELGNGSRVCFNLPTLDREKFVNITGSMTYDRSIQAIKTAIEKGIRVTIIVQGSHEDRRLEVKRIQKYFPKANVATYASNNRGGSVFNDYITEVNITEPRLCGCYMVTRHICVNVNGELMLCCNDFYHANTFGNIKNYSFQELLVSEKACLMRKSTWGGCTPPDSYICRHCTLMVESKTQTIYDTLEQLEIIKSTSQK